jgi:4-oxalocrotonate tautomerase
MPFITIKMFEGRTKEQKQELVKAITKAMETICNVQPESTMVVIEEVSRDHWAKGGVLYSER